MKKHYILSSKSFKQILEAFNISGRIIYQKSGGAGDVYFVGGKAVKITRDKREAQAAQILSKHKTKYIIQYYGSVKLINTPLKYGTLYAILMDKAHDIPEPYKEIAAEIISTVTVSLSSLSLQYEYQFFDKYINDDGTTSLEYHWLFNRRMRTLGYPLHIITEYLIRYKRIFNECKKIGFEVQDCFSGNFMFNDKGDLVLIDASGPKYDNIIIPELQLETFIMNYNSFTRI